MTMAAVNDGLLNDFPSFFKIILEPRHDLRTLAIPRKFMTDNGRDLLDVVSLKIPTGKTWEVELLKENSRAWFTIGWPEIVKFCSICHGHFLMFTYGGKSQFNLYIFDMTACEIEYPLDRPETRKVRKRVSENKTKKNSAARPAPVSRSQEKGMGDFVRRYIRKYGTLTQVQVKKINSYQFEVPSFTVVMQPSYVALKYCMNVPLTFGGKHTSIKAGSYTLESAASGSTWPVRCFGSTLKYQKLYMRWKEFVLDNNLRVGDICVFELSKASKRLIKVEIIRCSSDAAVAVAVASPTCSVKSEDVTEDGDYFN